MTVAGGAYFIHQSAFKDSFDDDEEYGDDDYDEHPKVDEKAAKKVYESELKSTRALMRELKAEHERTVDELRVKHDEDKALVLELLGSVGKSKAQLAREAAERDRAAKEVNSAVISALISAMISAVISAVISAYRPTVCLRVGSARAASRRGARPLDAATAVLPRFAHAAARRAPPASHTPLLPEVEDKLY